MNSKEVNNIIIYRSKLNCFSIIITIVPLILPFAFLVKDWEIYSITAILLILILFPYYLSLTFTFGFENFWKQRFLFGFVLVKNKKINYEDVSKFEIRMNEGSTQVGGQLGLSLFIIHFDEGIHSYFSANRSFVFKDIHELDELLKFLLLKHRKKLHFDISQKFYPEEFEYINQLLINVPAPESQ